MRPSGMAGSALLTLVICATGCSNGSDNEALLREEATNLRVQLEERNRALAALESDRRDLATQNAELRRQLDDASSRAADVGRTTGFEGIENVESVYGDGEVVVTVPSDVLFDSGNATLRNAAKASLAQVAAVISSQYPGNEIRVTGHTDTDPIQKSPWKTNYHLGSERAFAVMEFLQEQGIAADLMHIASYGPNRPMGTKAASRRVEIAVLVKGQAESAEG